MTIFLNGKPCEAVEGESVLTVALRNGFDIPHYCTHEDLPIDANDWKLGLVVGPLGAGKGLLRRRVDVAPQAVLLVLQGPAEGEPRGPQRVREVEQEGVLVSERKANARYFKANKEYPLYEEYKNIDERFI